MAHDLKNVAGWWRPSASHLIGGTIASDDGVSVGGAKSPTSTAIPVRADESGSQYIAVGPSARPTYVVTVAGVAFTANCMPIVVEAGTKTVHLTRLTLAYPGVANANTLVNFTLVRTTSAGTAGVVTPVAYDSSSAAFSGICRSLPTTMGTVGSTLRNMTVGVMRDLMQGYTAAPVILDFSGLRLGDRPHARTGEGLAFYAPATAGGASLSVSMEFVEWDAPA